MTTTPLSGRIQVVLGIFLVLIAVAFVYENLRSPHSGQSTTNSSPTIEAISKSRAKRDTSKPGVTDLILADGAGQLVPPEVDSSAPRTLPAVSPASDSSSSEVTTAFFSAREQLAQGHQQLMRELSQASPEEKHQAMEQWREENAEALAEQQQLAIQMGRESRPPNINISVPAEPHIPENATPELRNFLTARYKVHENVVASIRKNGTRDPNETT